MNNGGVLKYKGGLWGELNTLLLPHRDRVHNVPLHNPKDSLLHDDTVPWGSRVMGVTLLCLGLTAG